MVPELRWQHLPPDVAPDAALPPGVHLLLDEGDDAKHRLLPWLLGLQSPPAPARLHCGDWVCASAAYQAQVCSAPPPSHPPQQCITDWLADQQQRWPHWNADAWQQHVLGLRLEPHLDKTWLQLSTGTRRKFWQAAALASGAPITVLDAPDAGLDWASIQYLGQALDALAEHIAHTAQPRWVLVAHHDGLPGMDWDSIVTLPLPQ